MRMLRAFHKGQGGAMSAPMLSVILGIVMIAVAFAIFPVVLEGAEEVRTHANISSYTGLQSMVEIGPTVVFVVFLFGGIAGVGAGGVMAVRRGKSKTKG